MELVIKIEDYDKEWITNGYYIPNEINEKIAKAIIDGTPLPKGHGRLIDVDALREDFKTSKKITFAELMNISCIVDHASIIVEVDKENSNGTNN